MSIIKQAYKETLGILGVFVNFFLSILLVVVSLAIPGIPLYFIVINYFNDIFGAAIGLILTTVVGFFNINLVTAYLEQREK